MTLSGAESRFDATPAQALESMAVHDGPVVVDLDETLLLGNSTSLFLDSARPMFLAYFVVKVVDALHHRRVRSSGPDLHTRRVRALLRALPWSRWIWRRRAPAVVGERLNRPLADAIRNTPGRVIVSTKGYRPIVEPIVERAELGAVELVACDPGSDDDRDETKLRQTREVLAPDSLDRALVVTDSLADARLLEASGTPRRVLWPIGEPVVPFASTYLPGRYLRVKRPDSRYLRKIVKEDLALWVLGSVWLASNPVTHTIGLVVLAASFWMVYEYGYIDNDRMAERHEHDPKLSDLYHRRRMDIALWKPLLSASVTGAAGLWVLRWPEAPVLFDYLRWAGLLGLTLAVFALYNRFDKQTRVLLYPVLQLLRLGAFLALVPTTAITDLALVIMALLRWVLYFVYRAGGGPWPRFDVSLIRLIVFAAGSALLAAQDDWSDLVAPTTLSLLAWFLFLARHTLPEAVRSAHRIDRPGGGTGVGSEASGPGPGRPTGPDRDR